MGRIADIIGLTGNILRFGKGGPKLKANAGAFEARNTADSDFVDMLVATLKAVGVEVSGDSIVLNSEAAGAGADWSLTLSRAQTGMANDLEVVMPGSNPSPGQALTVANYAAGVITLQWTSIAGGEDKVVSDTTTFEAGDTSPIAMFTLPANAVIKRVAVILDESFDGTAPQLSVGISGTTSKYLAASAVDLQDPATTVTEVDPGLEPVGTTEDLIATLNSDGATSGSGRILIDYVIPS